MRIRSIVAALLTGITSVAAMADLYISPVPGELIEYVDGPAPGASFQPISLDRQPIGDAMRFGSNVPLFVALEHVVPGGDTWKINIDRGYENRLVSWNGGNSWEGVMSAIADQNNISIVLNHNDRVIGVSGNEDLAKNLAQIIPSVWRVDPDLTLRQNLEQLAAQAGWSLSWADELGIDYRVSQGAIIVGTFEGRGGAIDRIISAYRNQRVPLKATFYMQNNVVHISELKK